MKGLSMNRFSKAALAAAVCTAMVFAMAACSGGSAPAAGSSAPAGGSGGSGAQAGALAPAKDTLNVAVSLDSGTLDPLGITGSGGFLNAALTYMEPLLDTRKSGEREWVLATGIDKVSDIEYTLHVREGVTFSNGNPLTAEDVLFTLRLYHDDPSRSLNVQSLDFDKTAVVDDHTIDLWYTKFNAAQELLFSQVMIVDSETYDPVEASSKPVGTGPYVPTEYVVNSRLVVEARDDYWGEPAGIKKIVFKCMNEASQVTNALDVGEIDFARVSASDVEYIESLGGYNIETASSGLADCLLFNMSPGGALGEKDARDAVCYAIDRQAISDIVYNGYAPPVPWPLSQNCVDYEERFAGLSDIYGSAPDLDKAKSLADATGLSGKTLKIVTNGDAKYITVAELIQASLKEIGVTVEIVNYDQATYFSIMMDPSNYDMALFFSGAPSLMGADVFSGYPAFLTLGWDDKDRGAFIAGAQDVLSTTDKKEYSDKLFALTETFIDRTPWFGLCDTPIIMAVSKDISGFECWLTGDVRYEDWTF